MSGACPLCGSAPARLSFPYATTWKGTAFHYVRCAGCGAVFVDPVPTPSQLEATYAWDRYHVAEYAAVDAERYERTAARLAQLRPIGSAVLDFGCGSGSFLVAAAAVGFDVRGVEVTDDVAARAAAASGHRVDTLERVESADATFDVIVLRDVLPHVPAPTELLHRLQLRLRAGGVLFFDGPLEEGPSLVRSVAGAVGAARHRLRRDTAGTFAPTMLFRVDARTQRRFFAVRMGYTELLFERYETGWPYHVPGRRPTSAGVVAKEGVAAVARAAAHVLPLGNRFFGLYRPAA